MRIILTAVLFALIIYGFKVSNLNAMDNKQQALKALLEECLPDFNVVSEDVKKQINSLSREELKSLP